MLDRPLDIAFHNAPHSDAAEAEIRARVARIEQRFPQVVACRVSVEALHNQHRTGNAWEVHVVLSVNGRDLAVSKEPHHAKEKGARTDLGAVIREAFRAAEKRLDAFRGQMSQQAATPGSFELTGQITQIEPGADHGYLLNAAGTQVYFHHDSVTNGSFETLREGDPVHYVEEAGDAGPVATKVRVA